MATHTDIAHDEQLGVPAVGELDDAGPVRLRSARCLPALRARAVSTASADFPLAASSLKAETNSTRPPEVPASSSATPSAIAAVSDPSVPTAIVPYISLPLGRA